MLRSEQTYMDLEHMDLELVIARSYLPINHRIVYV